MDATQNDVRVGVLEAASDGGWSRKSDTSHRSINDQFRRGKETLIFAWPEPSPSDLSGCRWHGFLVDGRGGRNIDALSGDEGALAILRRSGPDRPHRGLHLSSIRV